LETRVSLLVTGAFVLKTVAEYRNWEKWAHALAARMRATAVRRAYIVPPPSNSAFPGTHSCNFGKGMVGIALESTPFAPNVRSSGRGTQCRDRPGWNEGLITKRRV